MSASLIVLAAMLATVASEPIFDIVIDGNFDDWKNVPSHFDPIDLADGSTMDENIADVHDADHYGLFEKPDHAYNPHVDIVEVKYTHDENFLYTYIRTNGEIARTFVGEKPGRYYAIVTVDVDNDEKTGYLLNQGGYYPVTGGYDVNHELEYYIGSFNQAVFLDHGAFNDVTLKANFAANKLGIMLLGPATYPFYTEYLFWDTTPTADEIKRCPDGPYKLPNSEVLICFTADKAPGPFYSSSKAEKNGTEIEIRHPLKGFLKSSQGDFDTIALGSTIKVSVSLETSGEYTVPLGTWATDTAAPFKYTLGGRN